MDEEEHTDTNGQLHPKSIFSESGNTYAVGDHQTEQSDDERASKKACFLRNDGENKVVVGNCLREVAELSLGPFEESLASRPAGSCGNFSLFGIPAGAGATRVHDFRGNESEDPITLIISDW